MLVKKHITIIILTFLCYVMGIDVFGATYYSRQNGNWGLGTTWSLVACGDASSAGSSPTTGDVVIICAGHTVNGNVNRTILSLTIEGTLNWSVARTIDVTTDLTMNGGTITGSRTGTLNVAGNFTTSATNNIGSGDITVSGTSTISSIVNITNATGAKTFTDLIITGTFNNAANSAITINGNLQNDGTCTFGTGQITFGGATSNTLTGTSTTNFTSLRINKGTSADSVLDVQSLITIGSGGLTLTNGTFKLSSNSTITPFPNGDIVAAPYLIPATAGFWCNGGTVNTQPGLSSAAVAGSGNWTVAGTLRISGGELNLGTETDQRFRAENSGTTQLIVEGGTFNISGRLSRQDTPDDIAFTISDGTINVPTVGSTSPTFPPINMDQAGSTFTMTGGTIVIQREGGSGAENLGFLANAGTVGISGGTIQFGDASTPASQIMQMNCIFNIANLTVNSSNASCQLAANLTVLQSINITAGTLDANNLTITLGNSWTNNGTWVPGTGTLILDGTGTQTITRTGGETFNNVTVSKPSGTVSLANNVQVNSTLTMTSGNINGGSYTLTLGTAVVSPGTLSYTAGTIIGNFKRWLNALATDYLFPVGTSSWYRPVLLNATAGTAGTLMANFVSSDPGSNGLPYTDDDGITTVQNQYTEGYWDLTAADGLSSTNYAVECTGNGFTSYSMGASTRLMYRSVSGNPWIMNGTHTAASGNTASRAGVNGLSAQFAFGKPACSAFATTAVTTSTPDPVCINQLDVDYSVDASNPSNTYTWSLPLGGGTIDPPGTGTSVTIDWGGTGGTYTVRVTEQNDCGDNNTPVDLSVTIHPITTSSITGATDVSTNQLGEPYSVTNTSGYTYNWTFPGGGGAIASGQLFNAVTVNWGAVPGTYSLRVDVTRLCGAPDFSVLTPINVRGPFYSRTNGNWGNAATWSSVCGGVAGGTTPGVNDEVVICAGNTVTMNTNTTVRKLTIDGTAQWNVVRTINVGSGGVIINSTGDIAGAAAGILTSAGGLTLNSNANISSTTVTVRLQTTAQDITTSGTPGALNRLDITTTATNNGMLTIANNGTLSGSGTLTQGDNSTLNMNGSTFSVTGFNASASGNTVSYGANADQTVRATTYNNLTLSGTGTITKTLGGITVVNGNLNISNSGVTLDVSTGNYALTAGGNWTNTGTFNERFGTVTFNGSSTQTISNAAGETFNNLVMSGSGTKDLANNITINFDFTLNSTLNTGNNDIDIRGNFDNSGTFNTASGNDVTFINNSVVTGSSATTFNNVVISATLTGHASNMNVSGNWTNNGTFSHNNGTVTFNGTTTIAGSSTNTFKNVAITGTLTAPAVNMNIEGNWNNSGTFSHNSGTLTFNGSSAQTIQGGNTFNNLTMDNSSGGVAVTSGEQNLINTLTLTNGSFNTNDSLVLISDASRTARIAEITGGSITGDITMQRYIAPAPTSWRFLSAAVDGRTYADWDDNIITSGFTGSDYPSHTRISIYSYDETALGAKANGYIAASDITNAVDVGKGYWVYIGPVPLTFDVKGATDTGSISLPVTFTSSGGASEDGWNMVGNPYPSTIGWNAAGWTKTNVNDAIYIWNPTLAQYASYINGVGAMGGTQYIPSQQAFWVQTNFSSPALAVTEQVKSAVDEVYKSGEENIEIQLLRLVLNGGGYKDETLIRLQKNASTDYDYAYDARKLYDPYSPAPYLSTLIDSNEYSINTIPHPGNNMSVPLRVVIKKKGNYVFSADIQNYPLSSCLLLEDMLTKNITDLKTNPNYSFTSDTTSAERFVLHLGAVLPVTKTDANCNESKDGKIAVTATGKAPWDFKWTDDKGNVLRTVNSNNNSDSLVNIGAGKYKVYVTNSSAQCNTLYDTISVSEPLPVQVLEDVAYPSCNYNNDGAINLIVSGGAEPYRYVWNTGDTSSAIDHLTAGSYIVTITDGMGCEKNRDIKLFASSFLKANFTVSADTVYLSDGAKLTTNNLSANADVYVWNIDKETSNMENFTKIFSDTGIYEITLIAGNDVCTDTISKIITVMEKPTTDMSEIKKNNNTHVDVIKKDKEILLQCYFTEPIKMSISISNALGQEILSPTIFYAYHNKLKLPVQNLPQGIYFIKMVSNTFTNTLRFVY